MSIAYLVNQYPQTSQIFIRREIEALEAKGRTVHRYTLRRVEGDLVDEGDRAERDRTRVILGVGGKGLALAMAREAMSRPGAFLKAFRLALKFGRDSERGIATHLVYLAEACVLRRWMAEAGDTHIHAHFGTNSTAVAAICRELGGPPFSFTMHGPEEFDHPRALGLPEKIRRASCVLAVTEYTRSQLYRLVERAQWPKIHVVRSNLDLVYLGGSGPQPPNTSNRLVWIGRVAEQKGTFALIEAAGKLRDRGIGFDLTMIGDGPMREEVARMIATLGLGDRVHLVGWKNKDDVRRAIIESRAVVLPSFAEGLPMVLMEAMALGRPAVSTFVAGIPELIVPGECGWLVPAGAIDPLVDALAAVLAAPVEELVRMGKIGSARAMAMHHPVTQSARILDLFDASATPPVGLPAGTSQTRPVPAAPAMSPVTVPGDDHQEGSAP